MESPNDSSTSSPNSSSLPEWSSSPLDEQSVESSALSDSSPNNQGEEPTASTPDEEIHPSVTEPLYEHSDISVFVSYLLIFLFATKYSLSARAIGELLQLLSVMLPKGANLPKTIYALKQFFAKMFPDLQSSVHYYCTCCHVVVPVGETCARPECVGCTTGQFISVPLQAQLKRKIEDPVVWKSLQLRFQRKVLPGVIQDVYDGEQYMKHSGFLSNPANVSLTGNTDGVAIFRSSSTSIWPVWLAFNELPKTMRFLKKNMILGALWFSPDKPTMSTFLRPLMDALNDLYMNGIEVRTSDGILQSHAMLLQVSADLPARALLLNMKQFNGQYGCVYCENPGFTPPGNPLHRFWTPDHLAAIRSHDSLLKNAKDAADSGEAVKGVKGATVLCIHQPLDLVKGIVIDGLHSVYLGVTLLLLNLWFGKANKGCGFFIGDKIDLCNERLKAIKVPDAISRVPQTLSDRTHWKGSQHRSWILFFAMPVLYGVLSPCYLDHLALLVASLHILCSDHITSENLAMANRYLSRFYTSFPDLYGASSTTMNVHLLSHLTACVKNWGPLWAYSCFQFESMNRELKALFHGTRDMSKQMAFSYVMNQVLPPLQRKAVKNSHPRIQAVVETLTGKRRYKQQRLGDSTFILGSLSYVTLQRNMAHLLQGYFINVHLNAGDRVQTFYRLLINEEVFFCLMYGRVRKRNSFTVLFGAQGQYHFGSIVRFFLISGIPIAVIKYLKVMHQATGHLFNVNIPVPCIHRVTPSDVHYVVPVCDIREKCIFIEVGDCMYVARFPSQFLSD